MNGTPTDDHPADDLDALSAVRDGSTVALWRVPRGREARAAWQTRIDPLPHGLVSGSFNPRHAGHDALRDAAEDWIGGPVYFELSLANADKPALDVATAAQRCVQFRDHPLLVTRAATFVEKARILPGTTFVVGADTAVRIVAPRFYGPRDASHQSEKAMFGCLTELRELECRFLVAARDCGDGLLRLSDVPIPGRFRGLFTPLPEGRFRFDVSSTELRSADGDAFP